MTHNWKYIGPNYIITNTKEKFSISFSPNGNNPYFDSKLKILAPERAKHIGGPETALCVNGKYYILNGDWRKQYENVIDNGLHACITLFKDNIKHQSGWSNSLPKKDLSS